MAKRPSPDAVIDLTLDDSDEEQESRLGDVSRQLYSKNNSGHSAKRARTEKTTSSDLEAKIKNEEIIQKGDDDDVKPAAVCSSEKAIECLGGDGEVEVIEASSATLKAAPNFTLGENANDELQIVGTRNELKLPHHRHDCTAHSFATKAASNDQLRLQNERHCELCYCYVCDALVKDCKSWCNADGVWQNSHCNATDKQSWWVKERQAMKRDNSGDVASGGGSATSARPHPTQFRAATTAHRTAHPSNATRASINLVRHIYAPGNLPRSLKAKRFPTCKNCGWHNFVKSLKKTKGRCIKCGRLTLPTKQHKPYQPPKSGLLDYNFGEREIDFRILTGDVRRVKSFSKSWKEADQNDPRWTYSEAAMKNNFFECRLGRFPSLQNIMNFVAEWDEERIRKKNRDAIILDNQNDIALLRLLKNVGIGSNKPSQYSGSLYRGDIEATWDEQTETGSFKIRLFLRNEHARELHRNNNHALLLGCWFKIFPFKLESISGTLKASNPTYNAVPGTHRPPTAIRGALEAAVSNHNKKADEFLSSLTLTSGSSNNNFGGYTSDDISLQGILERFYREHFVHREFSRLTIQKRDDWRKLSNHRGNESSDHDYILSYFDRRFVSMCLVNSSRSVRGSNTQDLLSHLENLGHEPELTCEGLTVELLEFQKQSLRWAMEKETTPGGIQSYFWVKVPIEGHSLYFNPILGRFRTDKPKVVRGGIIAEEMGLGKTIISLALILKHPAPELPISGTHISSVANEPFAAGDDIESNGLQWDSNLYSQTSEDNKLRGSVLSRGTLVVCPVSLVGQWIEEAKSKLSNPGLLYPYHGDNRIRDAKKLAKNAIVVTTYQILASDDSYHRKKSSNPDAYCPPLEQVRWWRIICDEGHCLRQGSTQRNKSLSKLVADNKWMVTGTPVSTSMLDLKSQLKLIGVEDVDKMFQQPSSARKVALASPGNLRFLMRNVMIRHTQKQVYRGTNTTLMSLPPKTERSIEVALSDAERKEYDALDQAAREFYVKFKAGHSDELSKHYLLLSQKLTPQRVACAGGHPPLNPEAAGTVEDDVDNDGEKKSQKKIEIKLSDFCFKSKLMALIRELKRARDLDPTSKSLVFSQFKMTLDWLMKELPKHGFQFRTLSGNMTMKQRAKALHDFQADPPTTIFLLSMRAGNCGINLTQANRVFLMEPGFNPALEKQAIGRVHRLGQKRNVEIIRLFIKDSIETRICKFLETKYGARGDGSKEGSEKKQQSDSGEAENEVLEVVGNLASERPKNKMVTSEFDMLFGVQSKRQARDLPDVAMPDSAISSDFL